MKCLGQNIANNDYNNIKQTCNNVLVEKVMIDNLFIYKTDNVNLFQPCNIVFLFCFNDNTTTTYITLITLLELLTFF